MPEKRNDSISLEISMPTMNPLISTDTDDNHQTTTSNENTEHEASTPSSTTNQEYSHITLDIDNIQSDDLMDDLIDKPSFWDGIHGPKSFKIIFICLIFIIMLNLTLWLRLAEWRHIIILFPLTEVIDYLHHEEMNFFLMVALFGFTIFGIYVTLENIKNIQDNVCILRTVSIVLLICPIFGFRTPFWIFIYVPFYGKLDNAVYKYRMIHKRAKKDDKITLIAIHHCIVDTLSKYREKENHYTDNEPWRRMEYEVVNDYLSAKLNGNYNNNFTESYQVMNHIKNTFGWKTMVAQICLIAFTICSEISLFRFLSIKAIIIEPNDWLFWFYVVDSGINAVFASCVLLWSFCSKMNGNRRDRMLQITQRYSWSAGYFILDTEEFSQKRFIKEFDAFYNKWAMSYWHRDVKKILLKQKYINIDVLSLIFEFVSRC